MRNALTAEIEATGPRLRHHPDDGRRGEFTRPRDCAKPPAHFRAISRNPAKPGESTRASVLTSNPK
jgi:hypothetical protein